MDRARGGRLLKFSFDGQYKGVVSQPTGFRVGIGDNKIYNFYPQRFQSISDFHRISVDDLVTGERTYLQPQRKFSKEEVRKTVAFNSKLISKDCSIILWTGESDTIFKCSSDLEIEPLYILDFGKTKIPEELISNVEKYERNKYSYPFILDMVYTNGWIFIEGLFNRQRKLVLYDTLLNKTIGLNNNSGIENDLDDGINFWPEDQASNELLYMVVETSEIISQLDNKTLDDNHKLLEVLKDRDLNSNPIMIFIEL